MVDLNIVLGGAAGQGIQSASDVLGKILLRLGFEVYITQDYQSRVRGGHNFASVRFSSRPLSASVKRIDFLLALNEESLHIHLPKLTGRGLALCMEGDRGDINDHRLRALPQNIGPVAAHSPRFVGVKLLAMLFALLGYSPEVLSEAVKDILGERLKPDVLQANLDAIRDVSAIVDQNDVQRIAFKPTSGGERMLVSGNEAIALGMIAAGVGVYVGYPMSPATSILNTLAEQGAALGIAVEQVEDEIAAVNAALGASYAGARAATGSSGGGLSLMTEGIGLAGVTETPIVIVDAQRPGPATGMATRTEQSDLLFIAHTAQGEFPRIILSPANHDDAFYLTAEAFNLAEKWQVPVFIMGDQAFADAQRTISEFDLGRVTIDRGAIAPEPDEVQVLSRYEVTESGVSPRAYPILSKWIVALDSHEHDEKGHLTDNIANRIRQVNKRMKKLDGIADSFPGPEIVYPDAATLLLCWGSTVGPVLEAIELLRERGCDLGAAIFRHLYPMNKEKSRDALRHAHRLITIEANYTGQLGKLLLMETGVVTQGHIGKFDGRIFDIEDTLSLIEKFLESQK